MIKQFAGLAHLVERHLAKVEVASSSLVTRSKDIRQDVLFCCNNVFEEGTRCLHRSSPKGDFKSEVWGPQRFAESMGCVSEFEPRNPLQGHPRGCPFFSIVKASGNRVKGFMRYRCEKGPGTARASSSCVPRSKDV